MTDINNDEDEYYDTPDIAIVQPTYPVLAQIVIAMMIGILLSPYSTGITYVLLYLIIYEIIFYAATHGKKPYWNWYDRVGIAAAYLLGWIYGRILAGWKDPFTAYPFETRSPALVAADPFGIKDELNIIRPQRQVLGTINKTNDLKNFTIKF